MLNRGEGPHANVPCSRVTGKDGMEGSVANHILQKPNIEDHAPHTLHWGVLKRPLSRKAPPPRRAKGRGAGTRDECSAGHCRGQRQPRPAPVLASRPAERRLGHHADSVWLRRDFAFCMVGNPITSTSHSAVLHVFRAWREGSRPPGIDQCGGWQAELAHTVTAAEAPSRLGRY
jgi:hypothetical protein